MARGTQSIAAVNTYEGIMLETAEQARQYIANAQRVNTSVREVKVKPEPYINVGQGRTRDAIANAILKGQTPMMQLLFADTYINAKETPAAMFLACKLVDVQTGENPVIVIELAAPMHKTVNGKRVTVKTAYVPMRHVRGMRTENPKYAQDIALWNMQETARERAAAVASAQATVTRSKRSRAAAAAVVAVENVK